MILLLFAARQSLRYWIIVHKPYYSQYETSSSSRLNVHAPILLLFAVSSKTRPCRRDICLFTHSSQQYNRWDLECPCTDLATLCSKTRRRRREIERLCTNPTTSQQDSSSLLRCWTFHTNPTTLCRKTRRCKESEVHAKSYYPPQQDSSPSLREWAIHTSPATLHRSLLL